MKPSLEFVRGTDPSKEWRAREGESASKPTVNAAVTFLAKCLGVIAVLVGFIWAGITFINNRVDNRIQDDEFIEKLAARIRPSFAVNSEGAVVADVGGLSYLKGLPAIESDGVQLPHRIVLEPIENLDVLPLLIIDQSRLVDAVNVRKIGTSFEYTPEYRIKYAAASQREIVNFHFEIVP